MHLMMAYRSGSHSTSETLTHGMTYDFCKNEIYFCSETTVAQLIIFTEWSVTACVCVCDVRNTQSMHAQDNVYCTLPSCSLCRMHTYRSPVDIYTKYNGYACEFIDEHELNTATANSNNKNSEQLNIRTNIAKSYEFVYTP